MMHKSWEGGAQCADMAGVARCDHAAQAEQEEREEYLLGLAVSRATGQQLTEVSSRQRGGGGDQAPSQRCFL